MKRFTTLLLLATFTGLAGANTWAQATGNSSTDDAVSSISTIRRPAAAKATPSTGPKKGLEATLSNDEKSDTPVGSFASTTPKIYLHWDNDRAVKGDSLRVVWFGGAKDKKLSEGSETMPGPGALGKFYLAEPSGGFPAGKYHVNLYEGPKLVKTLGFTVTK